MENFNQLCIWPATLVHRPLGEAVPEEAAKEFEDFFGKEGFRVKFQDQIPTNPDKDENGEDVPETGGRSDLFFYIHDEDISKFAVPRLAMGIRWWEDVLLNGNGYLYPTEILEKYPKTW